MKRLRRGAWAALAALAAACLAVPGFAQAWSVRFSRPALRLANRCSGALPFPIVLPLALFLLLRAVLRAAGLRKGGHGRSAACSRRDGRAVGFRKWTGALALWIAAGYIVLWLPAGLAAGPAPPEPDANALEALCLELIADLNRAPLAIPEPVESLAAAPSVAGLPEGRAKAALWPGWMRALRVAGIAVPWTGEAIVDTAAPPALVPYTAVHELMHIAGFADEGAANIAAWRRCLAAGGSFADSARLWALRYAAGMLAAMDEPRCAGALASMTPRLAALWQTLGGVILERPGAPLQGSYHDLARWLGQG